MVWDFDEDIISFDLVVIVKWFEGLFVMKCNMLKLLVGIFDFLGMIGLVIVMVKILF